MSVRAQHAVRLAALCCLATGMLGGCGDEDLPDGAVAKVRDHAITKAEVERAVVGQLAIRHSAQSMPPYLPADIAGCVAAQSKRPAEEGTARDELQRRCEQARDQQEAAAQRVLIRGQWYKLDAEKRGMAIPTTRKNAAAAAAHAGVKPEYLQGVIQGVLLQFRIASQRSTDQARFSKASLAKYNARLRDDYRDDTVCADGHDVPECK